ncbi:MAG: tandem-95 repeat protein, partial [Planctomycetales bacterium]|nr:tandem-95 repeat protein [Planctomycetales bacterium]
MLAAAPLALNDSYLVSEDSVLAAGVETPWTEKILATQPLHWWTFEETSGTTIKDYGSAPGDGTIEGGVTLGHDGLIGHAAHFDGTGFVRIGQGYLNTDWTVETILSVELDQGVVHSVLGSPSGDIFNGAAAIHPEQYPDTGSWGYTLYGAANWSFQVPSPTRLAYAALVGTPTGVDLYIDGEFAAHQDPIVSLPLHVIGAGHARDTVGEGFDTLHGLIDELVVYDRALAANEIAQHFQAMQETAGGVIIASDGVLANDTDADGDVLTARLVTGTTHGRLELHDDGAFFYFPDVDFHGADQFTYVASDGQLESNSATVTITVSSVNDPPVAIDDRAYAVAQDKPLSITAAAGVLANDFDVDQDPLTAVLVTPPVSGTVELQADGAFVYTSRPGMVGRDRFAYRVSDGQSESEVAYVSIRVLGGAATGSLASDDYYTVAEDQMLEIGTSPWLDLLHVPLAVNSLAYDAVGERLLATVPAGAGPRGGTLTEINPNTGELGESLPLPGGLGQLVISDDGETAHVVVDDGLSVQLVDLVTMTLGPKITFGDRVVVRDMIGIPGRPRAVAITSWDLNISQPTGTYIFENGIKLPAGGGGTLLAVDETGQHVFGYDNWLTSFEFWVYEVDDNGLHAVENYPWGSMLSGFIDTMQYAQGHLFTSGFAGGIVNMERQELVGTFAGGWIYDVVSNENALYSFDDQTQRFYNYDLTTFQQRSSIEIPHVGVVRHELTRFGSDGLALHNGTELILIRSDSLFGIERRGVMRNDAVPTDQHPVVQLVENVEHGTLDLHADGTFTYQPALNYHGPDRFRYAFVDETGTSHTASVNLTVTPVNDLPLAADDFYVLPASGPLLVDAAAGLLANDSDSADGDTLSAIVVRQPRHGRLILRADGSFRYQPNASFVLSDDFSYQASDGYGLSEVKSVEIRLDVPAIEVGHHVLQANLPNQRIDIYVTGGQLVSGIDLYAEVGDGGPERTALGLPAGHDGPAVSHVELKQGTIFADIPDGATNLGSLPQLANWSISVSAGGSVPAAGLMASFTIDTTGFFAGEWDL